jgi:NitT/TauT family transport system substrate-binding protein
MRNITALAITFLFNIAASYATEPPIIRLAVQASGTVAWELAALPAQNGFKLAVQPVANAEAAKIALQSGAVDMIVSDWLWVAQQRSVGADWTFYPYSSTSGALVVAENSPIHSIKDLVGKRLGIAGGALDKNWLLLQAVAQQQQLDLNQSVEKVMGAPPLLNEQLQQQRIDALLTYWHFAARLQSKGYRTLLDGNALLHQLGINNNLPTVGYVFNRQWAENHTGILGAFISTSQTAKNNLCTDDAIWQRVVPLTAVEDSATQTLLRQQYCQGRVTTWGQHEQQAAGQLYSVLQTLSHHQLTGDAATLPTGTFWQMP